MKRLLILLIVSGCQVDENVSLDMGTSDLKLSVEVVNDLGVDKQLEQEYRSFGEICDRDQRKCLFGFCLLITNLEGVCTRECCEGGFMFPCNKPICPSGWYCMGICIPIVEKKNEI